MGEGRSTAAELRLASRGYLGAPRRAYRGEVDLPEGHDERDHLGRLAGDQLRQAPGRAPRRHPAPGPDAADLGRRRAAEDGPSHEREGGQEEARGTGELTVRR